MVCENCSEENCDSTTACPSCGKPSMASTSQKELEKKNIYACVPHGMNGEALFRAKRGFPLQAGVLPTIPVQTASAVAPIIAPAPTRRRTLSEISDLISHSQIEKETANRPIPVEIPVAPGRQEPWKARTDPESRLPFSRRKRVKRLMPITTPLQAGLVGSIITVSMAIALGSVWWNKSSSNGQAAQVSFFSPPMQLPSAAKIPGYASGSGHSIIPEDKAPLIVASIQPDRREAVTDQEQASAAGPFEPPDQKGAGMENIPENRLVEPAKTSKKNITARSSSSRFTRIAKAEPSSRTSRRTAGAARKKERIEEIDRLKSQAFAETKKDRLDNARASGRTFAPTTHFSQQSAKRTSINNEFLQCGRHSNFIHREQCKWRLCGGKWGRNGCPSYQHTETASY